MAKLEIRKLKIEDQFRSLPPRVAKTTSNFFTYVPLTEIQDIAKRRGMIVRIGHKEDLINLAENIHNTKDSNKKS